MENVAAISPVAFVIVALLAGAIIKFLLRGTKFPYTVGLFCFGLIVGALNRCGLLDGAGLLHESVQAVGNINPDLILYIFLPVLIFDAAYELDIHTFRKTFANASLLAVPGVICSMFLVGGLMMLIALWVPEFSGWNWTFALMFGALISATDPVAVVALLKELNTSKRFSTLVDAESLLNDGTGIVLFMLFFGTFAGSSSVFESPVAEFALVVAGGAILGYVVARLAIWFITRVKGDATVQNSILIISAYLTFLAAEEYLHVSGVIALVAFGLAVTYHGKPVFSPRANEFTEHFWELAAYLANTLVFIMVGIIIASRVAITPVSLLITVGVYLGVNLIRTLVIFAFYPIMKRVGYGIDRREAIILSWGGLRGALGLALALLVSYTLNIPQDIRDQILLMTAGVVTLTLTVNATTIRKLLEKLGLTAVSKAESFVDYSVRSRVCEDSEAYLEKISRRESLNGVDWDAVRKFLPEAEQAPDISGCTDEELLRNIRMRLYATEVQVIRQLHAEGNITTQTFRLLTNSQERHFDSNGALPLNERKLVFMRFEGGAMMKYIIAHEWTRKLFKKRISTRIISLFDLGGAFLAMQRDSLEEIQDFRRYDAFRDRADAIFKQLVGEIQENIANTESYLHKISDAYPELHCKALTDKATRMLLSNEKKFVHLLAEDGILTEKDASRMEASINNLV